MCPTYLIGPWKNSLVLINSKGRVYTRLLSEAFYLTLINFDFISREINLSSRMTGVNSLFPSVPLWLLSTTWRVMRSEYWKECLITCLQAKWVWGWQNGIKSDSTDENYKQIANVIDYKLYHMSEQCMIRRTLHALLQLIEKKRDVCSPGCHNNAFHNRVSYFILSKGQELTK